MITITNNIFTCHTKHTTYAFQTLPTGQLEHLYYGARIDCGGHYEALVPQYAHEQGNLVTYAPDAPTVTLENRCLEASTRGKGDVREPLVDLSYHDGNIVCDFVYDSHSIATCEPLQTMPSAYDEKGATQTLTIVLKDHTYHVALHLLYTVFYDTDVIVRSAKLVNESDMPVRINRLLSAQLDLPQAGYTFTTFQGAWAREMSQYQVECHRGIFVNDSKAGTSSSRSNPFVMLSEPNTTETHGNCYGCNLVYSANHYEAVEVGSFHTTRLLTGIQPFGFSYLLAPNDTFESPQAVLTYSDIGFGGVSRHMHRFVQEHIVRGSWKRKERPVLLNSWEGNYFTFNEAKLLKQAKIAQQMGIELFVLDDGWFGTRNDDTSSLGDWFVNTKKLPGGLKGLAEKINALGMYFGIWVEPEMVNRDSECFRNHPEYAVDISGMAQSLGRNQLLLDLTKQEVQTYVLTQMKKVLSSGNISYVKWDMNRIFSDCYSDSLPPDRQGEFMHRYIMGLYTVLDKLVKKFPDVLFESCSSGGNRFDLGMLCYMPQTWASDNTDALCRAQIQTGYSYGYPMSTMGAHVSSCPNHQTLRSTPLETRFHIASFGLLGYEMNVSDLSADDRTAITAQVAFYKKYRATLQFGTFHRLLTGDNLYQWQVVNADKTTSLALYFQRQVIANFTSNHLHLRGLADDKLYHFTNRSVSLDLKDFGDLINYVSPVHIKPNSLVHTAVCKVVKKQNEQEDCMATGSVLNRGGMQLKQAFTGSGFGDNMRMFPDFASRLYIMKSEDKV